jgi:hypothetical protein
MIRELVPADRVRISPSVYSRAFGSELVLLDFGRGDYFALDEIGAEVFRRLEAGETLGDVADRLCGSYDVSPQVAMKDVVDLVSHMAEQGLVTVL